MSAAFWTTPDGRPGCTDCDWIAPPAFEQDDDPQTTADLHQLAAHTEPAERILTLAALDTTGAKP